MRILVACEESQRVCIAFRKLGHEAFSCDILPCSGGHPEWHIKDDVLKHLDDGWDLMIAHPPCTYMSKAGARFMYPKAGIVNRERLDLANDAKDFFMKLLNANIAYIAVENPTPLKIVGLPKESQVIQPYQYGEKYSKRTLLWLKGLPELKSTKIVEDFVPYLPSNTGGFSRGKGGSRGIAHNALDASKTFQGIADAMANQWSEFIIKQKEVTGCSVEGNDGIPSKTKVLGILPNEL